MEIWVYIDGFNLYYGAVKDTPDKWLDLHRMCAMVLREVAASGGRTHTDRGCVCLSNSQIARSTS